MKKTVDLWFGFMVIGVLLIYTGKAEAVPYPFFDDFENGAINWSAGGEWGLIESSCLGGEYAVTDSPGGSYPDNYNGSLTLASPVDLSTATSPVLIFWHKLWLAYADYALVEISTNGGLSWSELTQWYSDYYLGTWTLSRLDLSNYVGEQVKIRFRLRETNVRVADGWYIDNVEIREADAEPTLAYPFSDNFEAGLGSWLVSGCAWGSVSSECLDGSFAITDSPSGNYPDNANSPITLAGNIDLSSASSPVLIFWHKMWLGYADYALVEISTNGGLSWSELTQWYSDDYLGTWTLSRFDLSAYVGEQVKIRFRLRETNVRVADGWYIDKVKIREANDEPTLPYPFSDNFEAGLNNWLVSGCEWGPVPSDDCAGGSYVTDSPSGDYPDNANSMIILAGNIDLSTAAFPVLSFWHEMWVAYADYALVEISTDGGVSWSTLTNWYSDVYFSEWVFEQIDLSAYVGEQVKIRFRLRETNVRVADGWHLDTVSIGELDTTDSDGVPDELDNCSIVANWCQRDTNSDGYGNLCDGDLDNDGVVSTPDLVIFRDALFTEPGDPNFNEDADFDGDGPISTTDLVRFRGMLFTEPGPSGLVP